MNLVGWTVDVAWMSTFHVLIILITRCCKDVGFGCRLDFNVAATSNFDVDDQVL